MWVQLGGGGGLVEAEGFIHLNGHLHASLRDTRMKGSKCMCERERVRVTHTEGKEERESQFVDGPFIVDTYYYDEFV